MRSELSPFLARMDLREQFPRARFRYVLLRGLVLHLVVGAIVISYLWYALSAPIPTAGTTSDSIMDLLRAIFLFAIAASAIKIAYDIAFMMLAGYSIELEHLTISKGVFHRLRASFPLARINDVSIKRNFMELVFGLATVDILTASPLTDSGLIEGMSLKNALGLQAHLLALIETTLPNVNEVNAAKAVNAGATPELADHYLHDDSVEQETFDSPSKMSEASNP